MLLTLLEIRNRMLNCKPEATISVEFCEKEVIKLGWMWDDGEEFRAYSIMVEIHHLSVGCRSFERQMHKAKRFMKHNKGV